MIDRYKTPNAFRQALEARLRRRGGDLQRWRRQVAFERFLARLFFADDVPWMLKGGYALELRLRERARTTQDLDFTIPDTDQIRLGANIDPDLPDKQIVYEALQAAAETELDDLFEFRIHKPDPLVAGAPEGGIRCRIECRLAGRTFEEFRLDVGFGDAVAGSTEKLTGNNLLEFAEIPAARVTVISVVQHLAEKIHAYTYPWEDRPKTRVKDIVDLVLIVGTQQLDPTAVRRALKIVFEHRNTHPLPRQFPEPPEEWAESYQQQSGGYGLSAPTLIDAYRLLVRYWEEWSVI